MSQESQTEVTKLKEQLDSLNASRSEFEVDMKVDASCACTNVVTHISI